MIPPSSMSNKSLRDLLWRREKGTFDGLTCEGEVSVDQKQSRKESWVWDCNDVEKAVNK